MRLFSLLLLVAAPLALMAQPSQTRRPQNYFFSDMAERDLPVGGERRIVPQQYRAVRLDVDAVRAFFQKTPLENTRPAAQLPVLTLPMPDGGTARFRIVESPVMEDALQQKYPETRCYIGQGLDDPTATLSCDFTPWGFHAMILSNRTGTIFIDPYTHGDREYYSVYFKKDYRRAGSSAPFTCHVDDADYLIETKGTKQQVPDFQGDCRLRTYRLALACTGEYANFHGGTKPLVMAAFNTTMNRVNGVYRRDVSVAMKLVANTDTLIFFNANTDPYTNNNGGTMLNQNRTTCNARIGTANYDIGHVFSTGGGGIASLGSVCGNNKAQGVTGSDQPIGDAFDIDYVAHEMGHQFGGPHTFNGTAGSCSGNGAAATAVEPGSGTTIMAYAGICGSHNVQNNSDDYFHASSLQSMGNFITTGTGNGCAVKITTGNNAPTVNAGPDYTIPKSTPFYLTATGNDIDGDTLTYCWEQMDAGTSTIPLATTNTVGPMFRSFKPVASPIRYFPRLSDLNGNVNYAWEKLPSVARTMRFRVTVRDNNFGSGCTEEDDVTLTVNATAGPFQVTAPNTNVTWTVGETRTVTWNVASTDIAPINCANVRLLLSTNGGLTYPVVLAASVPNTGTADVLVPNNVSPLCRVKVESIGNIFYDISNVNFRIQQPTTPTFLLDAGANTLTACANDLTTMTLNLTSIAGFANPVQLSATGGPAGATVSFSPNPATPPGSVTMTLSDITPAMAGNYTLIVKGESGALSATFSVALTVLGGKPASAPATDSPADGAVGLGSSVLLSWAVAPLATQYIVEVADNPSFALGSIKTVGIVSPNSFLANGLANGVYYWRVRANNSCGSGAFSPTQAFQVGKSLCDQVFSSTDTPKVIDANSVNTISSTINVPATAAASDLNVRIQADHRWVGDLVGWVVNPAGKKAELFHQVGVPSIDEFGCSGDGLNLIFDDEATATATTLDTTCGLLIPSLQGSFQPIQSLSDLEGGKGVKGNWTLFLLDTFEQDGGQLLSWSLNFCLADTVAPGKLLTNNPLGLPTGGTAAIGSTLLRMETSGTAAQGRFTLLVPPQHGTLQLNGTPFGVGGIFTQADVDGGLLTYAHSGDASTDDNFRFDVLDEAKPAWLHDQVFVIAILKNDLAVTAAETQAVPCHNGNGGEITASATGLDGTYQYSLNGGPLQSNPVFSNLAPGTYTVSVSGQFGFSATAAPVTLSNPPALQASASVSDNSLTATASGGTGAIEYSLNGGDFQSGGLFENLANGPYTLTARDANGCTVTASAVVAVNTLVVSASVQKNVACFGGSDGSVSISVSGGQMPYLYSLNGGPTQVSSTFGSLAPGTYTVVVTDHQGFTRSTGAVEISQPSEGLAVSVSISDDDLSAASTGGTPPVEYSLDGATFQSGVLFENLANGAYTLTARDANGCTATVQGLVAVNTVVVSASVSKNVSCFGGADGSISAIAAGGQAPYEYSLNGGAFQSNPVFTGLKADTYTVEVKDSQGFTTVSAPVELIEPTGVTVAASVSLNIITATASGGTGAFVYSLDGQTFQANPTLTVLASGTYILTVRDANGCTGTREVEVTIPALIGNVDVLQPILCFGGTTNVAVTAEGGIPPYEYRLEGGPYQLDNIFVGLSAGTFALFVRDAAGTVVMDLVTINQPQPFTATVNVVGKDATLEVIGNNPPYSYTLNGAPNASLKNLKNGDYVLIVSDFSGCTQEVLFEVSYVPLSATVQVTDQFNVCDDKVDFIVTAAGGVPPYEYALNSGGFTTSALLSDAPKGNNTVTVRDAQGVTFQIPVEVTLPDLLNITVQVLGDSIVATATGGVGPYTYTLNNGVPTNNPVFANLPTGIYTVRVLDSRNCEDAALGISITSSIVEPITAWGALVSPNPGSGSFRLTLTDAPGALRTEVLDATGRLLRSLDFTPGGGNFTTLLDLTDLPEGLYALRLTDGLRWGAVKVVISR